MKSHDPLCPYPRGRPVDRCECPFIARIRADERERIANAIEAASGEWARQYDQMSRQQAAPLQVGPGSVIAVWGNAARIARESA